MPFSKPAAASQSVLRCNSNAFREQNVNMATKVNGCKVECLLESMVSSIFSKIICPDVVQSATAMPSVHHSPIPLAAIRIACTCKIEIHLKKYPRIEIVIRKRTVEVHGRPLCPDRMVRL